MLATDLAAYDLSRGDQAPGRLDDIETPAVLISLDRVEQNLQRWQAWCDDHGMKNRPHVKTHKLVPLAKRQLQLGAAGITCQKIGEAEVMADAGIDDILISYNILSRPKLDRLVALARRTSLRVVADSEPVADGLAEATMRAGVTVGVLVETDTGGKRCGVQSPEAAIALARRISRAPGLRFRGFLTYPAVGTRLAAAQFLGSARDGCLKSGLPCETVSTGGSPEMWNEEGLEPITEYRAGTYIYNDRKLVRFGAATPDQCAISVLATVVSCPRPDRAVIDAGSKALTSDLMGLTGFGAVVGHPDIAVVHLNEEHGILDLSLSPGALRVGDRIRVVPNHACVVSNLFDSVYLLAGERVLCRHPVDARGRVT